MRVRFTVAVLVLAAIPFSVTAQSADELFDQALQAYEAERYAESARAFEQVIDRAPDRADAYYWLARLYVKPVLLDPSQAKKAIGKALDLEPGNVQFLTQRLRLMRAYPPALLPALQAQRKHELAQKILALDSTNALANLELGEDQAAAYFTYRHAVSIHGSMAMNARPIDTFQGFEEVKKRRDMMGGTTLDKSEPAAEAYPQALTHLERALAADPALRDTYDPLLRLYVAEEDYAEALRVLRRMQQSFADEAATWLYTGMVHFFAGDLSEAAPSFDRAFQVMTPDEHGAFEDLEAIFMEQHALQDRFASEDADWQPATHRYWALQDVRLLTPENERRLEHYARATYADLFFRTEEFRGWDTEIGRVHIRYGFPEYIEDQTGLGGGKTDGYSRTWYYKDFQFNFVKSFPIDPYMFTDYILSGAKDVFYRNPARTQYDPPGHRESIPFLTSTFKSEDGRTDVYTAYAIPVPYKPRRGGLDLALRTGVFLLHPDVGLAVEQRRSYDELAAPQLTGNSGHAFWLNTQHLQASAGDYELAVEFETETAQVIGYERANLAIPDYTGDALMLSDVLLATGIIETPSQETGVAEGQIRRPGYTIMPVAQPVFGVGQPLYLYVEAYNLSLDADAQARYEVEAVLVPWQDSGNLKSLLRNAFGRRVREGVSAGFETTSTTPHNAHYLSLDTHDQKPGTYLLAFRVTDEVGGTTAETTRQVVLE